MTERACVDASVAAKWLVDEAGHDRARGLLRSWREGVEMWAPDLVWAEVANALRHKVTRDELSRADADTLLQAFLALPFHIVPCRDVAQQSLQLALDVGITVWDATYLAVAMSVDAALWTADVELAKKARNVHHQVHLLR